MTTSKSSLLSHCLALLVFFAIFLPFILLFSQAPLSAAETKDQNVPYIEEIAYWHRLLAGPKRTDLHLGLMLKSEYRDAYMAGSNANSIIAGRYSAQQQEQDAAWIVSQQNAEQSFVSHGSSAIHVAGYPINAFVGYKCGAGRMIDEDGFSYKVFLDFKNPIKDLTADAYLQFVEEIFKNGFVGDSKVPMTPGAVRFNYNNVIVHAPSPESAKIAERVARQMFGDKLAHTGRGIDVMKARLQDPTARGRDWHVFLSTNTDLNELSPKALKFVRYEN
jgi:hypothetical protein